VVHDRDSVTADSEAVLVGFAAALYSTVSADHLATVEDTERFLVAYCHARGREFTAGELERSWAAGIWTERACSQALSSRSDLVARRRLRRLDVDTDRNQWRCVVAGGMYRPGVLGSGLMSVARGRPRPSRCARASAALAMCVIASACGGESAGGGDAAPAPGALPEPVCAALDRLDETGFEFDDPAVFDLDAAALAELLADRRDVLAELAEATEGELHDLLEDRLLAQPAVDEAILDTWDEDRVRFADEHTTRWLDRLVPHDVRQDDGEPIDVPEYWRTVQTGYERLVVGCRAPELADGPEQETTEDPPPGRLAYYRRVTGETGHLVTTTERGTGEDELELAEMPGASEQPRRWDPTGWLDASPGPDPRLVLNVRAGDEYAMVVAALDGTIVDFVQRSREGPIVCPSWDRQGERVLAWLEADRADHHEIVLVDPTGATPTGALSLPFATVGCADFISDHRIVVADAAIDIDDEPAVWTVGVDGSDPREVYRPTGECATQVGSVDPDGTRVALALRCEDPLDGGIVVVDLADGELRRVATGTAALPKWSPDGEWLVFGYAPLGEGPRVGTWIARRDGSQLREVVASPAWFPVWLRPA
jgi:hypothetical protein